VITIQLNLAGVSQVSIEAQQELEWLTDSAAITLLGPLLKGIEHELRLGVENFLQHKPTPNSNGGAS
jgi:hypothetical protein